MDTENSSAEDNDDKETDLLMTSEMRKSVSWC